jgi:ectoine hydroxylase-related dioxygenase (phytanoyl-CoA dioxygenase family)
MTENLNLKTDGWEVEDINSIAAQLNELKKEIFETLSLFSVKAGGGVIKNDGDIINFRVTNQPLQFQAIKHLQSHQNLFAIAGSKIFSEILKRHGFIYPNLELPPNLRCDIPIKEQSLFEQHQDYSYNIGSKNSVTVWIPLQDTPEEMGALQIAPKSHLDGVYPNLKGIISEKFSFTFLSIPINFGQALFFNQKIVHRSGINKFDKVRFSIQLRFTDLGCEEYAKRGYPINHKITTEQYDGDLQVTS